MKRTSTRTSRAATSLLPELQRLRREYPTPLSKAQTGELLTRVAQSAPGWALLAKPSGNNCPAMGTKVSCDYLVDTTTGTGYDVLVNSEGAATPIWNKGTVGAIKAVRFVLVGSAVVTPPVVEPPVVVAPVVDPRIDEILKQLAELKELIVTSTAFTFPNYRGSVFGATLTLRPE